ncbi:Uma2 family endonuclease [Pseudanabaena sp. PCC 6802]|uniref:Uma2 family endonuclease n=1 Tax=Pseudanabaena sp. PCC 6802 TaxID=118173 RepID=UPI000476826E|nr:Uma2 family endonuclease [Pseudanabaena sp. PCC 6802]
MTATAKLKLTFEEYLQYNDGTDNRYELVDGELVLMPTASGMHALILVFLFKLLDREITRLGLKWTVMPSNVGVRTAESRSRIPDLVVLSEEQTEAIKTMSSVVLQVPPLLVVEIVSPDDPARDYRYKRSEYATRGIPEYWIIDPVQSKITVLILEEGLYEETAFVGSQQIESSIFPDLKFSIAEILSTCL